MQALKVWHPPIVCAYRLWIAAYLNDVFAYVPSARVLEEGGYETRGTFNGDPGFFSPEVERRQSD